MKRGKYGKLHNINFITCYKAEITEDRDPNIDPSSAIYKIIKRNNVYKIVFMTPRRTYLPSINALACSKAEI